MHIHKGNKAKKADAAAETEHGAVGGREDKGETEDEASTAANDMQASCHVWILANQWPAIVTQKTCSSSRYRRLPSSRMAGKCNA